MDFRRDTASYLHWHKHLLAKKKEGEKKTIVLFNVLLVLTGHVMGKATELGQIAVPALPTSGAP